VSWADIKPLAAWRKLRLLRDIASIRLTAALAGRNIIS
jgi:hypothetical protein